MSKSIVSNITADILEDPTQEEPMPSWASALIESVEATNVYMQALDISIQSLHNKFDQHDNEDENLESLEEPMPSWARTLLENVQANTMILDRLDNTLKHLESPDESDFWEDNSPQIEIPKDSSNDPPNFSNFVPSNDQYLRDMTYYQYNEVRVDIPMFKKVDEPKEYFNMDMTRSLPKTTESTNPNPRANSTIRCFNCRQIGHIKTNCPKLAIVMDDSNPLPTNDSKKFELEDENYGLDKAISLNHAHIIHAIVLKQFASSYERYKTFIAFPRRYKILKPSDLVDIKIHPPKLLKISFKFQLKTMFLLKLFQKLMILHILYTFLIIGAYLLHLLLWI